MDNDIDPDEPPCKCVDCARNCWTVLLLEYDTNPIPMCEQCYLHADVNKGAALYILSCKYTAI